MLYSIVANNQAGLKLYLSHTKFVNFNSDYPNGYWIKDFEQLSEGFEVPLFSKQEGLKKAEHYKILQNKYKLASIFLESENEKEIINL